MRLVLLLLLFHLPLFAENSDEQGVIICGICRNVSTTLDVSIRNIEQLGSRFKDYAVVIYENNSTDDTSAKLSAWANVNPHVLFLTETLSKKRMRQSRTV